MGVYDGLAYVLAVCFYTWEVFIEVFASEGAVVVFESASVAEGVEGRRAEERGLAAGLRRHLFFLHFDSGVDLFCGCDHGGDDWISVWVWCGECDMSSWGVESFGIG